MNVTYVTVMLLYSKHYGEYFRNISYISVTYRDCQPCYVVTYNSKFPVLSQLFFLDYLGSFFVIMGKGVSEFWFLCVNMVRFTWPTALSMQHSYCGRKLTTHSSFFGLPPGCIKHNISGKHSENNQEVRKPVLCSYYVVFGCHMERLICYICNSLTVTYETMMNVFLYETLLHM